MFAYTRRLDPDAGAQLREKFFELAKKAAGESRETAIWASPQLHLLGLDQAWVSHPLAQNSISTQNPGAHLERADAIWSLISAKAQIKSDLPDSGTGLLAFASFTFDPEESLLVAPKIVYGYNETQAWVSVQSPQEPKESDFAAARAFLYQPGSPADNAPNPAAFRSPEILRAGGTSKTDWNLAVDSASAALRAGGAEKVVLAREAIWRLPRAPKDQELAVALTRGLAHNYPSCWVFNFASLVGASPEMLVEADNETGGGKPREEKKRIAKCRVLAGTGGVGQNQWLESSQKNAAEHAAAVESVTQALRALLGDRQVHTSPRYLLELPNLVHLATNVRAEVPAGTSLLRLAAALHPTAAVCGKPRGSARALISRFETISRHRYSAPIGWVDGQGRGQLALALRCAQVSDGQVRAWAGAGIMPQSRAEDEWVETENKLSPIRESLADLKEYL